MSEFFNSLPKLASQYWVLTTCLVIIIWLYLYRTHWYWKHAKIAEANIYIDPVAVKGGIADQLGPNEAGFILRAQLNKIKEIFSQERKGHASLYMASAFGDRFKGMAEILELDHLALEENLKELEKATISEELSIRIGAFQIPVGSIINFFVILLRWIPVSYRQRYLSSLIHVTLVSVEEETQVIVSRSCCGVLTLTKPVKNLSELNDLLLDAAFMVVQIHGKTFPGIDARSMRYFADGVVDLEEYKRTGNTKYIEQAENKFSLSTTYDSNNYAALYFYGSLLLLKRKTKSINTAIKVFNRANIVIEKEDKKENQVLKGLINSNLAICYSQKIHRLAECSLGEQEKAIKYANEAEEILNNQPSNFLKSWILSVCAQVIHAEEGTKENRPKENFFKAATYYCDAIDYDKENGTLYNNLGWVLLKLAEWGVNEVNELGTPPEMIMGNTSKLAEKILLQSLVLDPNNKLSHANLCLLYANSFFRSDSNKYYNRCVFHGRKAIMIDKEYINGYRDLTISLIRYKKLDEAYKYYEIALELSAEIEKDNEIISDVLKVVSEMKIPKRKWKEWQSPNPDFLLPPEEKKSAKTLENNSNGQQE